MEDAPVLKRLSLVLASGHADSHPVPSQEIPSHREEGGGKEAPREEASECLHVVYEGDEGQGGGRVHPEGKRGH